MLIQEFRDCLVVLIGRDRFELPNRDAMWDWLADNGYQSWQFEFESCIDTYKN